MQRTETVIIGGGVVGASVAYHLTERGAKDVLILEREAVQGRGSTGAATGGVRSQFETEINIKLSLYSLDFFNNWEYDCEYDPAGYLFFAATDAQLEYLKQSSARQRELGVRDVEIIDADDIKRIVPFLNCDDIAGGSFGKHDGFINPLAVMNGFTDAALRNGAEIQFETQAVAINTKKEKIVSVETNKGVIECENVVLCTGAWAKQLAATVDIDLPVSPQRRQIVWARAAEPLPTGLPMVIDIGTGFHFRPAKDWNSGIPARTNARHSSFSNNENYEIIFAFPDPDEPSSTNTAFDDSFIDKVYQRAKLRAPYLYETELVREKCRAGLYENSPDHHAILGGCDVKGLYFANGFSGHGVMHSPATGRALSEIILDGKASFLDVSCLSIERFSTGKLLHETAFI
ncbi:MAG: FAD-binding oxidoreductase [Acidobacteria bacterium]|nr:FAD-binding oxidoreductase [Acidobacteriota bacterium]